MGGLLQAVIQQNLVMYLFFFVFLSIVFRKPKNVAKVLTTIFVFNAVVLHLLK